MKVIIHCLSLLCFVLLMGSRNPDLPKVIKPEAYDEAAIEALDSVYGQYKTLPEAYRLQALIALSYYPELRNTEIVFQYSPIKTTMAARPAPSAVFQRVARRKYHVFINNAGNCEIPLSEIPFNAQVGIIGHELAHILDYEQSTGPGIMGAGLSYATARTKALFEKQIDRLTIDHGLGWQLYDWADYAIHRSNASDQYKAFKKKTYLLPREIKALIQQMGNH